MEDIVESRKISLRECSVQLDKARKLVHDEHVKPHARGHVYDNSLSFSKRVLEGMLRLSSKSGYLFERQVAEIDGRCLEYATIKNLNGLFGDGFRDYLLKFLEEVYNLSEVPLKGNIRAYRTRGTLTIRRKSVLEGAYFWHIHVSPAVNVLDLVEQRGVAINGMKEQATHLRNMLYVPSYVHGV